MLAAVSSCASLWIGQKSSVVNTQVVSTDTPVGKLSRTQRWSFPAGSLDPLLGHDFFGLWFPGSRLASEESVQTSEPSVGCEKTNGWPSVQIPMDQFNQAFGGKPGETPELLIDVDPKNICFTVGSGIWVIGTQKTTAGIFSPDAIWSRIQRIEKIPSTDRVRLVTQFVKTPIYHWPSRVLPPFHPQAQILHRLGLVQNFSKFKYVIDVRPVEIQKQWPLPWTNVISIPYLANLQSLLDSVADREDLRRAKHESLGDRWMVQDLEKWDRNSDVLVIGQNPSDSRPARSLTWLSELGFKKLFWFYEGADAFHLPLNEVPVWSNARFNIIEHVPQVENLVKSGQATLIDVRTREEFKIIHHPLALNRPYKENAIQNIARLRGLDAYDIFQVLKSGDEFDLKTIPQTGDLFLMGSDRYDWRAVKLYTRLLHKYPNRRIGILRDGIADFGLWQRIDPNLIRLVGEKAGEIH